MLDVLVSPRITELATLNACVGHMENQGNRRVLICTGCIVLQFSLQIRHTTCLLPE